MIRSESRERFERFRDGDGYRLPGMVYALACTTPG
jgi:hypothetical protein